MENIQFEVADFETAYNAFLGRLALTKFVAILHYAYEKPSDQFHGLILLSH
jgi:hypothetical protein